AAARASQCNLGASRGWIIAPVAGAKAPTRSHISTKRGVAHEYRSEVLASFSFEIRSRAGRCRHMCRSRVQQGSMGASEGVQGRNEIPGQAERRSEMQQLPAVRRS